MTTTQTVSETDIDLAAARLTADGYTVHERSPGPGLYLADIAPDSEGESTEPGSAWDEKCDEAIDNIRELLASLDVVIEWSDNDVVIDLA